MEMLTAEEYNRIDKFLTKRKASIVNTLAGGEKVSQKKLAQLEGCSQSTLSAVLQTFDKFEPQLVAWENEGKSKVYFLTPVGGTYWETRNILKSPVEDEVVEECVENSEEKAVKLIKKFVDLYGTDWEQRMDDFLFYYEQVDTVFKRNSIDVKDEHGELIMEELLETLKDVLSEGKIQEYDNFLSKSLRNRILRGRIRRNLSCFFCIHRLEKISNDIAKGWQLLELLDELLGKMEVKDNYYIVGIEKDEYEQICYELRQLAEREVGKSRQEIYEDLRMTFRISNNFAYILSEKISR
ncbi:MAG: hypothetical protein Q4F28_14960 [Eubacteriales bacterium]|nr:hypothetical protein [Eubacteriales bacterium]